MKTQKLLEKAKISLILNEPFFASAALQMEYQEDTTIETAFTNGLVIVYNPDFFTELKQEERVGLIAHEIMHIIMLHHLRIDGRDIEQWNAACDFAINPILQNSGITIPEGGLINSQFEGLSAEEIYNRLNTNKQPRQNEGGGKGANFGNVVKPPKEEDLKELEQRAKQMALDAYNAGKQAGNLPQGMQQIIKDLVEPKQNWKEILNRFVSEVVRNDYTWVKPNPRYLPAGMYLPALESLEIGKIAFAIDTSGSINNNLFCEFLSEIREAMSLFHVPVTVIHCDSKIQRVEQLTEDDKITPVGGGGTAFQPVFDYVNKEMEDAKAIIYFTDGEASDTYKEPVCPVLWAIYGNSHFKCDFGEIINVEN